MAEKVEGNKRYELHILLITKSNFNLFSTQNQNQLIPEKLKLSEKTKTKNKL